MMSTGSNAQVINKVTTSFTKMYYTSTAFVKSDWDQAYDQYRICCLGSIYFWVMEACKTGKYTAVC